METITIWKNSPRFGFKKGDVFPVKRDINGNCVIVMGEDKPNLVWTEKRALSYGNLAGEPKLYMN